MRSTVRRTRWRHAGAPRCAACRPCSTSAIRTAPHSPRAPAKACRTCSSPAAYRVPFQFSPVVRSHLRTSSFIARASGVTVEDVDGNVFHDLTGSYGVNVFGVDFYKDCMAEGLQAAAAVGPMLGSYLPCVADNVERLKQLSGAGRGVVPHERHRSRDAGRAPGALPHRPAPPGALCRRVPRLVGRRAARPRQPTAAARDLHPARHGRAHRCRCCARGATSPACWSTRCRRCTPTGRRRGDSSLVDSSRTAGVDRAAYADWLRRLRAVCSERGIVLILDEIFVGFRLAPGGAQEYFGVQADMVTYGKTLAGGLPVGVVCGRRALMKRYREDRPADICFARGTFNAHPHVMASMKAFLDRLHTPAVKAIYDGLDERWNERARQLQCGAGHGRRAGARGEPVDHLDGAVHRARRATTGCCSSTCAHMA